MNSARFKTKKNKFTQISNSVLLNEKLSLKAKGLYSMIEHYVNIPNFILYKNTLLKKCKEKDKAFNTAWKELKDEGYLIQEKKSNGKGHFFYEYELLDEPIPPLSTPGLSTPGKRGIYNNTDLNNTDLINTEKEIYTSSKSDAGVFYENGKDLVNHLVEYTHNYDLITPMKIFYLELYKFNNIRHGWLSKENVYKILKSLRSIYTEEYMYEDMIRETMDEYVKFYFAEKRKYYSMQEFFQVENFRIWYERTKWWNGKSFIKAKLELKS